MLQGTGRAALGLVYPSAVPPSLLGSPCHLAFRGLLFPTPWAAFCIFHITKRARGCLVCVGYVFLWITSINILNQFSRAGYLSWVWVLHEPGQVWKGKQEPQSLCLSVWTPVHGTGNVTVFTPVEWRVGLSRVLECTLTVGSQWRSQNLKPGLKECTSDSSPDPMLPNWMALRNSTSLTPRVIFRTQWMLNSSLPIICDPNVVLTCFQRLCLLKL